MIPKDKNKKISIIMPTYNRGYCILETLESIKEQSFTNWECIIVDDGSTDNTKQIIQPLLQGDNRFIYKERNLCYSKGPSGCRNYGLDLASGEYVIFFDSDDIVHPKNLQICIDVIAKGNYKFCRYDKSPFRGEWDQNFIFSDKEFSISDFSISDITKMVTMEAGFACCTVMWEKSALKGEKFNEELSYAEEWEFYTRLLSQGISGASINKTLYYNRKHDSSNTAEFWANHTERRISKIKAVKKVINTLSQKKLLNPVLIKYFVRWGFFLKNYSIIDLVLINAETSKWKRLKYKCGFLFYPVIKPFFYLKSKFLKS